MNIFKKVVRKAAQIGMDAAQSPNAEKIYNTVKIISAISDESRDLLDRIDDLEAGPKTVIEQSVDSGMMEFEDIYLDEMEEKIRQSSSPARLTNSPYGEKKEKKNKKAENYKTQRTDDPPKQNGMKPGAQPEREKSAPRNTTEQSKNAFACTKDQETGTIIQKGDLRTQKGNHKHMPKRTKEYRPDDERGHIQASSLGGDNSKDNVVPQSRDLNHGAYLHMEQGEKDALKAHASIQSEKIAYTSNGPGSRPSAFMVNDTITYADGKTEQVHLSFANLSNKEQEDHEKTAMEHTDMLGEPDYEAMGVSREEYDRMMDECGDFSLNVRDEYADPGSSVKTQEQTKPKKTPKEAEQDADAPEAANSKREEPEKAENGNGVKPAQKQQEQEEDPSQKNTGGTKPSGQDEGEGTKAQEESNAQTPRQQENGADPAENKKQEDPQAKSGQKEPQQETDDPGVTKNKSDEPQKKADSNGMKPSQKSQEQEEDPSQKNTGGTKPSGQEEGEGTKAREEGSAKTPQKQEKEPDPSNNKTNGTKASEQDQNSRPEHQSSDPGGNENKNQNMSGKKPKAEEASRTEPTGSGAKPGSQSEDNRTDKGAAENTSQPAPQKTENTNNTNTPQKNTDSDNNAAQNKKDDGIGR